MPRQAGLHISLSMKKLILLSFSTLFFLVACGAPKEAPTTSANPSSMPTSVDQAAPPAPGETVAVLKTNKGDIKIKFFSKQAPETVKNFLELSKKGFYDGLIFHRVIPDFMIQGGDPTGTGAGGETYKGPGTTLNAEFSSELKHIRGAVSMARKGNDINSATSQFFIVQNKAGAPFLDDQYTIFGQAFGGLAAVDAIANVERDAMDKPKEPVVIEKIELGPVHTP